MAAYHLREIWQECDADGCKSRRVVSLYSRWNDRIGDYCRKHGNERMKRMTREYEMNQKAKAVKA